LRIQIMTLANSASRVKDAGVLVRCAPCGLHGAPVAVMWALSRSGEA